jgi:hypothetical protein
MSQEEIRILVHGDKTNSVNVTIGGILNYRSRQSQVTIDSEQEAED